MKIIAIIGRTCSGKSSLSLRMSSELGVPSISVGHLIRRAAEEDETIRKQYAGPNGFEDAFVASLIARELESIKTSNGVVIEGSIGFGLALEEYCGIHKRSVVWSFNLECPAELRKSRFESRNTSTTRSEPPTFFAEREALFDRRLGKDFKALTRVGNHFTLNCEKSIEFNSSEIQRRIDDLT